MSPSPWTGCRRRRPRSASRCSGPCRGPSSAAPACPRRPCVSVAEPRAASPGACSSWRPWACAWARRRTWSPCGCPSRPRSRPRSRARPPRARTRTSRGGSSARLGQLDLRAPGERRRGAVAGAASAAARPWGPRRRGRRGERHVRARHRDGAALADRLDAVVVGRAGREPGQRRRSRDRGVAGADVLRRAWPPRRRSSCRRRSAARSRGRSGSTAPLTVGARRSSAGRRRRCSPPGSRAASTGTRRPCTPHSRRTPASPVARSVIRSVHVPAAGLPSKRLRPVGVLRAHRAGQRAGARVEDRRRGVGVEDHVDDVVGVEPSGGSNSIDGLAVVDELDLEVAEEACGAGRRCGRRRR